MPITHFAVGLVAGLVVSCIVASFWRRWLYYAPVFAGLCGFWAQMPDLLGAYAPSSAVLRNVFFLHAVVEAHTRGRELLAFSVTLGLLNLVVVAYIAFIALYLRPGAEREPLPATSPRP